MQAVKNERGYVLIFVTLMIVLLLVMVGIGLDTGHLAYVRSQGQPAVDAAALAAASVIPTGDLTTVKNTATKFDPDATGNPGVGNNYVSSPSNAITGNNVTLVHYDPTTHAVTTSGVVIDPTAPQNIRANGARVALENNNPYGGTVGAAMKSPLFLTPLFNMLGYNTSGTADVSVSAVGVIRALPGMPIVVSQLTCDKGELLLDFQSGGKSNSGWETYYITNASTAEIRALWDNLPSCSGQPIVDIGYCGNLANGVNATIFNSNIKPMFKADPKRCYLIPVVANPGNLNQCQKIIDWARFCPDLDINKAIPKDGQLFGSVTCGQSTWTSRDTKCYVPLLVRDTKSGM